MKILITGANGFIGSNLTRYLEGLGFQITKLTRKAESPGNITWNEIDNGSEKLMKFDVYIHLVGKAHDLNNSSEETDYREINYGLTKRLFDIFLFSEATIFIFISSVKAVADHVYGILTEETIPNPITFYGKSKREAEEYILSKTLPENKNIYILRPCMIHGLGNKGNLNLLFRYVDKGIPYPLGAFNNRRSFLSIDNFCFITGMLISKDNVPSGIYNIADDEPLTTKEVIEIIGHVINTKPIVWHISKRIIKCVAALGEVLKLPLNNERLKKLTEEYIVDNCKIKKVLGISKMPTSVRDGLVNTIKSFKGLEVI